MTQDQDSNIVNSVSLLKDTAQDLCALAEKHQHESLLLLSLLRDLEQIHRQIRINYFESALPQTRNDLYKFVKDIEEKGGWPYIERMRLRDILKNIEEEAIKTSLKPEDNTPEEAETEEN
ncbi:MAG: hypothetical protein AAF652_08075 [Cyanobacteria bacterium P01_C01_bin.72]